MEKRQVLLFQTWGQWLVWLALVLLAGLAASGYLFASNRLDGPGFPLDDAWIHQTYARNLASWGQWSYIKDQPSAGSTAPLWSVMLALGYWLNLNPLTWAYLLGSLGLALTACFGQVFFKQLMPQGQSRIPWTGIFLAVEWHLVWAAVSGMETAWLAALVLLILGWIIHARGRQWIWVGLLIGLGVWVRPDAITLIGPALFVLGMGSRPGTRFARDLGWFAAGFVVLFGPYLLFNLMIQGSLWPNTFYAKQAEYAELRAAPLLLRYASLIQLPLVGAGLLLVPGFLFFLYKSMINRFWAGLGAAAWFLGFVAIYAERLPVTYQYGRYLIPAMPVYFVLGIAGLADLVKQWQGRAAWVLTRSWLLSLVGVCLGFYAVVAGYYARDVSIIENEMVATAHWLAKNTEPGALLAVHDIGAIGYFSGRRIVDLAGLISPEVIPFMRNEAALAGYLDSQGVDYLVTLDGWYTWLPEGKTLLYASQGKVAHETGGTNMRVYRWK